MLLVESGLRNLDAGDAAAKLSDASGGDSIAVAGPETGADADPKRRIVFTDRALPPVQPVNYALAQGDAIIRMSSRPA
ncbi:hypothetical protein [Actinomadura sp. SCN-SB]|uniref:hypothetical protein n=1 Tax=Actinomadura sp. SCN-SB TaxID=3373092 RepID=UPI0037509A6D